MTRLTVRLALLLALVSSILVLAAPAIGQRTPDSMIAYSLQSATNFSDIYLVDEWTQVEANLTYATNTYATQPIWSPDGSRMAYYRRNGSSSPFICVFDGATRCYVSDAAFTSVLRWSPDDQTVAYRDSVGALVTYDLNSGRVVHNRVDRPTYWQWSPDGRRFAITVCSRGAGCEIDLENGDMSALRPLYQSDANITSPPSWSPDGSRLLFTVAESGHPARLDLLDVTSRTLSSLADVEAESPAWAPDGMQITFISTSKSGRRGLYLLGAEGGTPYMLTEVGEWQDLQYAWSADGTRLLVMGDDSAGTRLFILNLQTRQVETIPTQDGTKTEFAWSS